MFSSLENMCLVKMVVIFRNNIGGRLEKGKYTRGLMLNSLSYHNNFLFVSCLSHFSGFGTGLKSLSWYMCVFACVYTQTFTPHTHTHIYCYKLWTDYANIAKCEEYVMPILRYEVNECSTISILFLVITYIDASIWRGATLIP